MRNHIYKVIGIIALSSSLCAADEVTSKVEIGQGFRNDSLKWSTSGHHKKPDVLSELDYKNLHTYLTTLKARLSNGTYLGEIEAAYGEICSGTSRDSDYFKSHKIGEFSRCKARVPGDYSIDALAKVGRIFHLSSGMTFTSRLGYGTFWQKVRVKDGKQVIPHQFRGKKLKHLNSTYKARWSAPFVECLLSIPLTNAVTADLGYTFFYPVQFKGEGHWNLRHRHMTLTNAASKSFGQKGTAGLRWALSDRLELGALCSLSQFQAKGGHEKARQPHFHSRVPGHKMSRLCTDYMLTLSYAF
jgi:hypothetical protein